MDASTRAPNSSRPTRKRKASADDDMPTVAVPSLGPSSSSAVVCTDDIEAKDHSTLTESSGRDVRRPAKLVISPSSDSPAPFPSEGDALLTPTAMTFAGDAEPPLINVVGLQSGTGDNKGEDVLNTADQKKMAHLNKPFVRFMSFILSFFIKTEPPVLDVPTEIGTSNHIDSSPSGLPSSDKEITTDSVDLLSTSSDSVGLTASATQLTETNFTVDVSNITLSFVNDLEIEVSARRRSVLGARRLRHRSALALNTCLAPEFIDVMSASEEELEEDGLWSGSRDGNQTEGAGLKRVHCGIRNYDAPSSPSNSTPSVLLFNSTQLLQHINTGVLRNASAVLAAGGPGRCTVVLFYAPWCRFSAAVAPHYNALARAFPTLDVVAIDAYHFSHLNSRFGTIAVPNIMLFHNGKAVGRFNGTQRTLDHLSAFITNHTGIRANSSVMVTDEDRDAGPLSSVPTEETDYLLGLAWTFVIICGLVGIFRSAVGIRVLNTLTAIGRHEERHIRLE